MKQFIATVIIKLIASRRRQAQISAQHIYVICQ